MGDFRRVFASFFLKKKQKAEIPLVRFVKLASVFLAGKHLFI
jgi:hypothetical protein